MDWDVTAAIAADVNREFASGYKATIGALSLDCIESTMDRTAAAWGYVVPGGRIAVSTGVSSHSPTNHAPGHALDFAVYRPDGSRVQWNDPEAIAAARIGRSMGVLGIGGGRGYMGGNSFHWDVSANNMPA